MSTVQITPNHKAIYTYYQNLKTLNQQNVHSESNLRRAFSGLLNDTAKIRGWTLIEELSERQRHGTRIIRVDGTLRDAWHLPRGYWEAKDTDDDLDTEIRRKRDLGYPFENIIFEDSIQAVLFQDGYPRISIDLRNPEELARTLTYFYNYEIEPFKNFEQAIAYFQKEIPHIATSLKDKIEQAHQTNRAFQTAFANFMDLCRQALNPNISPAAVDEMLIQHMLTERLIRKVFHVEQFTRRNVIAGEVETVIDSLTSNYFNRADFLGSLERFYVSIEDAAERLADFTEKQRFLNTVYEKFFQGYSVKVADTHGIVYTPQEIVDFMCAAVEEVLANEFGKKLGDDDVYIIDPCTGTGNFVVNLLRRAYTSNPRRFERFYREQLFANEVMLMPYYIASLNIEHEYYELTGQYEPFEGVCFVDTLDLAQDRQMPMFTEANAERVERQKQAPITIIIGNPPYNVGQLNENDNNKNRKYAIVDKRVSDTYARDSKASNKNALSDAYVKFFRWATDRLQGRDGIICYVSNNSFVDQFAFDGMRKHLLEDFTSIHHIDLHGNVRQNPKLSGTTHNVFGIQVGVGITVAVRKTPSQPPPNMGEEQDVHVEANMEEKTHSKLFYNRVPEMWRKEEKLKYLTDNVDWEGKHNSLNTVQWTPLIPDDRNTWLVPENADEFETFISIGSKETKSARTRDIEAIFRTFSNGVKTNRDTVVYDFNPAQLIARVKQFIESYNAEVDRYNRSGRPKDVDNFVDYSRVKWSRDLKLDLQRGNYAEFSENKVRNSLYRPFTKQYLFFDRVLNEEVYVFPSIFPTPDSELENQVIWLKVGTEWPMFPLITNTIVDLLPSGGSQCFPFYVYDEDGGNRRENITDWALAQFRARYGSAPLPVFGEGLGVGLNTPAEDESKGWAISYNNPDLYHKIKPLARQMRSEQTAAEKHLWQRIRHKQVGGYKFRRQHVVDRFVVDFYCAEARLVIEVDGPTHQYTQEEDALRTAFLESLGLRVLRFSNGDVFQATDAVVERIGEVLQEKPHPQPLPKHRGGSQESGAGEITKWDIFYYVYGLLHHPTYRERYADNLKRELPRIPFAPDFWAFSHAGKKLAELHLKYEDVKGYDLKWETKGQQNYRVEKMRLSKDKTTLKVNDYLTLANIPAAAFKYRLGNRSALEWVIDQYQVKTDSRSGISSDPNGYSDNPRYIVDLVEKVVRVSVDTVQIVDELSALDFRD